MMTRYTCHCAAQALATALVLQVSISRAADSSDDSEISEPASIELDGSTETEIVTDLTGEVGSVESATSTSTFVATPPPSASPAPTSDPFASPQTYALELRLGPYLPSIDEGTARTSQQDFFGSSPRIYVGFEFDWQLLRIPYLGTVGVGASLGYSRMSGLNQLEAGGNNPSELPISQESTLTVVPTYVVGVLRVDEAARRFSIPVVPYGKLGFGYSLWSVNDGVGIARSANGDLGQGSSSGLHAALGGMLLLDVFEPSAARSIDVDSGINNSYLFLEWSYSSLGSANDLKLGDSTWVAGLALEM